jgi:arylsulfatase
MDSALAQQTTAVPGSPEATTTITGKQFPPPDPKFDGVIKQKASESTPWPPRVVPPKNPPNVLLIMTDDQGFGAPSTFGGVMRKKRARRCKMVGVVSNHHAPHIPAGVRPLYSS